MSEERPLRRDRGADSAALTSEAFHSADSDKADLFVYGTLLNRAHVKLLLNRDVEMVPATLHNYMRVVPPGAFYFIVRQHGAETDGKILKGLSPKEIALIDSFEDEGSLYFRRRVVVRGADGERRRCMTYVGNIPALQKAFGKEIQFEDRFSMYLERKIDRILQSIDPNRHEITRRALRELLGAEVDTLISSHFDGNYICNYIMVQSLSDAKPKLLVDALSNPGIAPYADNYIAFACRHIIFNQIADRVSHEFPDSVRLSRHYFRHGLSVLLAFLYCNRVRESIQTHMREKSLDRLVPGRLYRDYAVQCINVMESVYRTDRMLELIDYVNAHWYSTPTPLGAELEFSYLGARTLDAQPGDDPVFDAFYWFDNFDLQRRTWRLGGHVDSHRNIGPEMKHARGFFEYALGRFNIVGDLSRPLFDCPWGMSRVINEAVCFAGIPPHSLHISMELPPGLRLDRPHRDSDLACLLLLGGDLRPDSGGRMREWRIYGNELDTNRKKSLNFSDRKQHYSRPEHEAADTSDVMEYKYIRLRPGETDYRSLIVALKGYQFSTHARPITVPRSGADELPEQTFLRRWAAAPEPVDTADILGFLDRVEAGLLLEHQAMELDRRRRLRMEDIYQLLMERNSLLADSRT